ncbi:MAG: alpha/beta fold hydrolase [Candidatus Limnocylindria bacterium]
MTAPAHPARRELRTRWYVVDNRPMHALVSEEETPTAGSSPPAWKLPIVLVHGLGLAAESMRPLGGELAALGYRVYAPDLPGFGGSAAHKPPRALDVPETADALDAWMRAADVERAAVVGNSIGAQVATDLAVRRHERIAVLVLLGPTTDPAVRSVRDQVWRWLLNTRVDQSSGHGMIPAYLAAGLGRVARTFRYSVEYRIETKLPRVRAPTLVVSGSADPITPLDWVRRASELLPDGRLVTLDGAGHSIHGLRPRQLSQAIHGFLTEHQTSETAPTAAGGV